MRLGVEEAWARLRAHDHGVVGTVHPERGVHVVPAVYAVDHDGFLGVPIDRVKPKASSRLQRERNLAADPRAVLLVDSWTRDDWSQLWWVRADLRWIGTDDAERSSALASLLAARYEQYRGEPFDRVLVFEIVGVTGWAGTAG